MYVLSNTYTELLHKNACSGNVAVAGMLYSRGFLEIVLVKIYRLCLPLSGSARDIQE